VEAPDNASAWSVKAAHAMYAGKATATIGVSVPSAGKLTATGKGVSKASKTASGAETVSLVLNEKKAGKLKTSIKLTSTPRKAKKLSKSLTVKFKQ
jgi:hypothetical protein